MKITRFLCTENRQIYGWLKKFLLDRIGYIKELEKYYKYMKATAKCPRCKKTLMNDCRGCIEANIDVHLCKGMTEQGVVENIPWKLTPETEKDLERY